MDNFMEYAEKFLYYEEVIAGKSFNTIKGYRKDITQFIDYLNEYEKIKTYDEIETMTFRSFIAYLNSSGEKEDKKESKNISKRRTECTKYRSTW